MNQNYDEKQLADRGKAFQYGFIAAILTIMAVYFITDIIEIQMNHTLAFLICMWVPLSVCTIALILKDAYDGVHSTVGQKMSFIFGAVGFLVLITTIVRMITGKESIVNNGVVTDSIGHLFVGICLLVICIVYRIKQYENRKKYLND